MAIVVDSNTAFTRPALTYDRIHVNSYTIRVDENTFKYIVNGVATIYADDNGTRVFSDKKLAISSSDFEPEIVGYMIQKGEAVDAADAVAKIAQAKTDVQTEFAGGTLTTAKLMAYFELAIGMQFQIQGKAGISQVV